MKTSLFVFPLCEFEGKRTVDTPVYHTSLWILSSPLSTSVILNKHYYKLTSEWFPFATGKYKTQLYDENVRDFLPSSPGIGMHVEVKDPNLKVILSKYYSSEGRFTFTSHAPGEHLICLHSNSTRWSLWAGGKLVSNDIAVSWSKLASVCVIWLLKAVPVAKFWQNDRLINKHKLTTMYCPWFVGFT